MRHELISKIKTCRSALKKILGALEAPQGTDEPGINQTRITDFYESSAIANFLAEADPQTPLLPVRRRKHLPVQPVVLADDYAPPLNKPHKVHKSRHAHHADYPDYPDPQPDGLPTANEDGAYAPCSEADIPNGKHKVYKRKREKAEHSEPRGRKPNMEIERYVLSKMAKLQNHELPINADDLREWARAAGGQGSSGWLQKFITRHGIVLNNYKQVLSSTTMTTTTTTKPYDGQCDELSLMHELGSLYTSRQHPAGVPNGHGGRSSSPYSRVQRDYEQYSDYEAENTCYRPRYAAYAEATKSEELSYS